MWIYYVLPAIVLLLLLGVVLFFKKKPSPASAGVALSPNELMFKSVLEKAVGGQYLIFDKVAVVDVLEPFHTDNERAKKKALKPIQGRVFDYLVCDANSMEVVCAVELDDHSYDKKSYKKVDLFLEDTCAAARLPLLRVPAQKGYNLSEIIERFERTIASVGPAEAPVYQSKHALSVKKVFVPQ